MDFIQQFVPMSDAEIMVSLAFAVALGIMIVGGIMHMRSPQAPRARRAYDHEELFSDSPTSTTLEPTSIHTTNPHNGSLL